MQPYTAQDSRIHDTVLKHKAMTQEDFRTHGTVLKHKALTQGSRTVTTHLAADTPSSGHMAARAGVVRTLAQRG